jgi:4-oxalocrotonate tautomerase
VQPADWSMGNGEVTYAKGVPADRLDPNSVPADFKWPDSIRA